MSFDGTETYLIPPRSLRQAQQPPAIRYRIGKLVVELSVIEFFMSLVQRPLSEGLVDL